MNLGKVDLLGRQGYVVYADFPTVGGLKSGAAVEIAGVPVGRVQSIGLQDFQARVALRIDEAVKLQTDAIVSIKTKGLIGEKFVQISPGGSDKLVPAGGRLTEVEAPDRHRGVDLEVRVRQGVVYGRSSTAPPGSRPTGPVRARPSRLLALASLPGVVLAPGSARAGPAGPSGHRERHRPGRPAPPRSRLASGPRPSG